MKPTTCPGRSGRDSAARPRCYSACTGRVRCGRPGWRCPTCAGVAASRRWPPQPRPLAAIADTLAARLPGSHFRQCEPHADGRGSEQPDRPRAHRPRFAIPCAAGGVRRPHLSVAARSGREPKRGRPCVESGREGRFEDRRLVHRPSRSRRRRRRRAARGEPFGHSRCAGSPLLSRVAARRRQRDRPDGPAIHAGLVGPATACSIAAAHGS